jgi:hypothetical protein
MMKSLQPKLFCSKTVFRKSININRRNLIILRNNIPHVLIEHARDSSKLNSCCVLSTASVA